MTILARTHAGVMTHARAPSAGQGRAGAGQEPASIDIAEDEAKTREIHGRAEEGRVGGRRRAGLDPGKLEEQEARHREGSAAPPSPTSVRGAVGGIRPPHSASANLSHTPSGPMGADAYRSTSPQRATVSSHRGKPVWQPWEVIGSQSQSGNQSGREIDQDELKKTRQWGGHRR